MNKIFTFSIAILSFPAVAQTLPLSQSATFKTKADAANPTFTGTASLMGPSVKVSGNSGTEGSVALQSSGNQVQTGYVSFFQPNQGSRVGYVGFGTSSGLNFTTDVGSIYLNAAGAPNPMIIGKDGNGKLQVVINNLPVSCTNEPIGTLYVSGHTVLIC